MVFMPKPRNTIDQALWANVEPTGFCWNWRKPLDKDGYGTAHFGNKRYRAHRLSYETLVGPIPEGLVIDHLCRNKACVNPDHLEPVTNKENLLRGFTETRYHSTKTHCKNGHEYNEENTQFGNSQRYCRPCARDKQKRLNNDRRRAYRAEWARKDRARKKAEQLEAEHGGTRPR